MKIAAITLLNRARFIEHYNNPEQMVQFTDDLFVDYSALEGEDHSLVINAFVNDNGFKFVVEDINAGDRERLPLNQDARDIFEFIGELTAMIINRDYEEGVLAENRFDLVKLCLQKTTGDLADKMFADINMEEEDDGDAPVDEQPQESDPNLIYMQMVCGQMFTVEKNSINWDDTIENLDHIAQFQATIKQMIFDLYTKGDDEIDLVMDRVREVIANERQNTSMDPDYSKLNISNEKEGLLLQLFDLNTIYEQIILIAAQISVQNQMMKMMTSMGDANTPVEDIEDKVIAEEDINPIEEVPVEEVIEEPAPVEEVVEEAPVEELVEEPTPDFTDDEKEFLRKTYGIRFPGDDE